ncbi:MAG TPA: hypothetical protein PKD49_09965 [Hyphomicrobium sp.]|nr:hypothetical protein [Hyphomicrobium sp.]
MSRQIDISDIPPVAAQHLLVPMREAIAMGQGLALLNGMSEAAIRQIEATVWKHFADAPQTRLAVALRFRALLEVFRARRLKQLFLMNGFKLIARAVHEAASQRLNIAFGFNAHKFHLALAAHPFKQAGQPISLASTRAA